MSIGSKLVPLVLVMCVGCVGDPTAGAATASAEACTRPVPSVVLDTDMDFDDAAALAYLCAEHQHGNVVLRGVTIENDGAGLPGSAIRHARCLLAACGLPDVPVAEGSAAGAHAVAPELRGVVELVLDGAFAGCGESSAPGATSAPELLRAALDDDRGGGDVVLVTTGPLTNVAAALSGGHGRALDDVDRVVIMAGALDVPGNLLGTGTESYDGTQELNAWADPAALEAVLARFGRRVTLVPLDATSDVPVTQAFLATLATSASTASADVVVDVTSQPIVQFGVSIGAFFWWDPLAAVTAVSAVGTTITTTREDRIAVVTSEGPSSGRTTVDRRGRRITVARAADRAAFESAFLAGLNETD